MNADPTERIKEKYNTATTWMNRMTFGLLLLCVLLTGVVLVTTGNFIQSLLCFTLLGAVIYVARWIKRRGQS